MADVLPCGGCGGEVPLRMAICPSCGALIHRARLEEISAGAQQAASESDVAREASLWREALTLLPKESKQHDAIAERIAEATKKIGRQKEHAERSRWAKVGGPLGVAGALLWKLKVILIALLTKGKLLLLGLTKLTTLLSMLAFLGVYWKAWGFPF